MTGFLYPVSKETKTSAPPTSCFISCTCLFYKLPNPSSLALSATVSSIPSTSFVSAAKGMKNVPPRHLHIIRGGNYHDQTHLVHLRLRNSASPKPLKHYNSTIAVGAEPLSPYEGLVHKNSRSEKVSMKSTKVQTLGAYCMSCSSPVYYANARARKLATPRILAVTRGAVSSRSNTG